ncbi:MAG: hypothetical protein JWP01_120 [Myxococcales bacterium]|nr:hypothetical protein [Myxococcales bacterium]
MLNLTWLGTYVQTQHDDHEDVVGQGEIDLVHDQNLVISEARLAIDIGLTRRFGVSMMVPARFVATSIRYLDTGGAEVELVRPGIHHRNERVTGLGDPLVLGSFAGHLAGWRLTARAGMSLPLGRTEENPFVLGDVGLAHQHIQLGTGTVNPVFAAEAARSAGAWRFGVFALTQQVVYENAKGYQAGDRYAAGLALRRRMGPRWSLRTGLDVQAETAERWDGIVHTDDGNRGRLDLILGAGASWSATPRLTLDLAVKIPLVTYAVGGQLEMPAIVELGAAWSFGGPAVEPDEHGEEHEHGDQHDHGDEHGHADEHDAPKVDTAGLDVADLGAPGEAVALVPVPGKLTIFDFWAPWCEPCKILEPALVEIARAHPDTVAIRRIDVVDWDSAAAAKYLTPGGFNLPHLKIYDARGQLVLEESSATGKLEALIERVRGLAAPRPTAAPPSPVRPPAQPSTPPVSRTPAPPRALAPIAIKVTANGFEPANVTVPRGTPVTLRFERTTERTCATEVVLDLDGKKIVKDLPLHQHVDLTLTFAQAGTVSYACAMNMVRGTITVR